MARYELFARSELTAPRAVVWAHALSMEGVNEELWPVRMSHPPGARVDGPIPLGEVLFTSVVTYRGLFVLDVHRLKMEALEVGRFFRERSTSLLEAEWLHERTFEDLPGGGTAVADRVEFSPRLLAPVAAAIVRRVFTRRHARLRQKFGGSGRTVELRRGGGARPHSRS